MTLRRRIRRAIRRAPIVGMLRARRAVRLPRLRMHEIEASCHFLIRLGLLQDYDFHRTSIVFHWAFHPSNIIRPADVADQTILRYTDKLEQKWSWSMRKLMRTARVCNKRIFDVLRYNYHFPLDYKF